MQKTIHYLIFSLITAISSLTFAGEPLFVEKSVEVGLNYQHIITPGHEFNKPVRMTGGIAIGDVDGDGWEDIFVTTGALLVNDGANLNPNKLLIADQLGGYTDQADAFGLSHDDMYLSGPLIVDLDGDGFRDLVSGGVSHVDLNSSGRVRLYKNMLNHSFADETVNSGLPNIYNYSTSAGDFDRDGDLDLAFSHWEFSDVNMLWQNSGNAQFTDATSQWLPNLANLYSFTIGFEYLNADQYLDLLIASDFGHSNYYLNSAQTMVLQNPMDLTDQNGMGASTGDYDNDGDMDWFVTSIYAPAIGKTGNRLYQNDGNGNFTDVSLTAGVRDGAWGWGSCFADFNNDGWLDIFHVNGYYIVGFENQPSRLFINSGDGTFQESAAAYGIDDYGQGKAVLCFDQNRDGKLDVLIGNTNDLSKFYQNNIQTNNHYLQVKLQGDVSNIDAIGAQIEVTLADQLTQKRSVLLGNSYLSSAPITQHFGLAEHDVVQQLKIIWPDGAIDTYHDLAADQRLVIMKVDILFAHDFD